MKGGLCIAGAVFAWFLSIIFSSGGFAFETPGYEFAGLGLGIFVTIMELAINQRGDMLESIAEFVDWFRTGQRPSVAHLSPTMFVAGILAYTFGIYTNILGIWIARGQKPDLGDFGSMVGVWFMPVVLGLALEITPEPLFLLGMKMVMDWWRRGPQPPQQTPSYSRGGYTGQHQPKQGSGHRQSQYRPGQPAAQARPAPQALEELMRALRQRAEQLREREDEDDEEVG